MRKPIIAGNWKMNKTVGEAIELIEGIKKSELDESVEKIICPPYLSLVEAKKITDRTDIKIGSQNMHFEESGAFTGEISPLMLKDIGIEYVILGHSERRQYFNEDDSIINKKVKSALEHGINPIICVGESLEEREASYYKDIVRLQVKKALIGVDYKHKDSIVIAYEPIWAIGTGKTASSEDANDMCKFIRSIIKELYDEKFASTVRILYGGSVKPDTIKDLMEKSDVDGALVGGASLQASDYKSLVNFK